MIAASGSTRPGATSRRAAISSRAYHSARTRACARGPRTRWMPEVRRHGSGRSRGGRRGRGDQRRELLGRPRRLALPVQLGGERVAQVDQQLDVQRRVGEPGLRQRPGGPVGRRVVLLQRVAEQLLGQRGQADPLEAGQPRGELGVEQRGAAACPARPGRAGPGWRRAGPTRRRRAPRRAREVVQRQRVDQRGAGAGAAQLHQVGPLGVAVAGGPLGVDGDRAGAGGETRRPRRRARRRSRPAGRAVAGRGQRDGTRRTQGRAARWCGPCILPCCL